MKKIILFVMLAISATMTKAQTNPKPGFIITNTGDTIRGIIDFRTNQKLSKQCDFWANGETKGKTYKPGDIEGFRFDNNGKYFVSRRLNVTGNPELYFAEFMVNGKMNLYCVSYNSDDYFFFEREDGEMAQLVNRSLDYASNHAIEKEKDILAEKKEQYGKVTMLLKDSWTAVEDMKEKDMSRKKLVNVVRDYHKDVCTDGSMCMVYSYDEKADKSKTHFKAFAGYAYYSKERTDHQAFPNENYPGSAFEIGIGVEVDLERVMKGFSIEGGLAFSPKASSEHKKTESVITCYEKGRITFAFGAVKRFGNGNIQPLVRCGGFVVSHFGAKEIFGSRVSEKYSYHFSETSWGNTTHWGAYLGAGAQMAVGKHYVRLHGDWYKSIEPSSLGNMMKWGVTAEFGL